MVLAADTGGTSREAESRERVSLSGGGSKDISMKEHPLRTIRLGRM